MKLDQHTLSNSRVIAKGLRVRDVARLVNQYGGRASRWVKKSGPMFRAGSGWYEYHWYERPGIGRFEIKRKRVYYRP